MITATDLEVRAGVRTLLTAPGSGLRVQAGDRIGLVGRNGAGKTTTLRILAGEGEPYAGTVIRSGDIGYLPQDPKEGNLDVLAKDRVLSARGLDEILRSMEKQQALMAEAVDEKIRDRAVRKYGSLEERFATLGGYVAESEAASICHSLGLPTGPRPAPAHAVGWSAPPCRTRPHPVRSLGRLRREVRHHAAARRADQPPRRRLDHLAARIPAEPRRWLIVISHDVDLLADVVNKVWFLDAVRGEADVYNMGWKKYLDARATDEARRRRERANAEKKASALQKQAAKLGAKATKPLPPRTWPSAPRSCSPTSTTCASQTRWPRSGSPRRPRAARPR